MAASHYAYNMLKTPGPMNIITVPSDKKDALICTDQLYRRQSPQLPPRHWLLPLMPQGEEDR